MPRYVTVLGYVCLTASIALAQLHTGAGPTQPTSKRSTQVDQFQIDWDGVNAETTSFENRCFRGAEGFLPAGHGMEE